MGTGYLISESYNVRDTWIDQINVTFNYGRSETLTLGHDPGSGKNARPLFTFQFPKQPIEGAKIKKVWLCVYRSLGNNQVINVYASAKFSEGKGLIGSDSVNIGANWNDWDGTNAWATGAGDPAQLMDSYGISASDGWMKVSVTDVIADYNLDWNDTFQILLDCATTAPHYVYGKENVSVSDIRYDKTHGYVRPFLIIEYEEYSPEYPLESNDTKFKIEPYPKNKQYVKSTWTPNKEDNFSKYKVWRSRFNTPNIDDSRLLFKGTQISVVSTNAGDTTQTATVVGLNISNEVVEEAFVLNGTTRITSGTWWTYIDTITLDGACAGDVNIVVRNYTLSDIIIDTIPDGDTTKNVYVTLGSEIYIEDTQTGFGTNVTVIGVDQLVGGSGTTRTDTVTANSVTHIPLPRSYTDLSSITVVHDHSYAHTISLKYRSDDTIIAIISSTTGASAEDGVLEQVGNSITTKGIIEQVDTTAPTVNILYYYGLAVYNSTSMTFSNIEWMVRPLITSNTINYWTGSAWAAVPSTILYVQTRYRCVVAMTSYPTLPSTVTNTKYLYDWDFDSSIGGDGVITGSSVGWQSSATGYHYYPDFNTLTHQHIQTYAENSLGYWSDVKESTNYSDGVDCIKPLAYLKVSPMKQTINTNLIINANDSLDQNGNGSIALYWYRFYSGGLWSAWQYYTPATGLWKEDAGFERGSTASVALVQFASPDTDVRVQVLVKNDASASAGGPLWSTSSGASGGNPIVNDVTPTTAYDSCVSGITIVTNTPTLLSLPNSRIKSRKYSTQLIYVENVVPDITTGFGELVTTSKPFPSVNLEITIDAAFGNGDVQTDITTLKNSLYNKTYIRIITTSREVLDGYLKSLELVEEGGKTNLFRYSANFVISSRT